jgi:mannose PTS system EIIA component
MLLLATDPAAGEEVSMIGVVLASHGEVAPALLRAAEAIVGPIEGVKALTLQSGMDPARLRVDVEAAVREVDDGEGVLVLCDMFGGTPSNVCLACATPASTEVVTGVNLPMLLKVASLRSTGAPVEELAAQIAAYGQRHIAHATRLVRDRQRQRESAENPAHAAEAPR